MNRKFFDSRYFQIVVTIMILIIILGIRLFVVTVLQQADWNKVASSQSVKTIYTSAPRGEILDRYGRKIAINKQIFTVTFNVSSFSTEQINNSAYKLITVLEKNGDKYVDNFPIIISNTGKYTYTYKVSIKKWLNSQGYASDTTADEAFQKLRAKYDISPDLTRFKALDKLQTAYGVYPPISVKKMVYTYDADLDKFLSDFGFTSNEIKAGISAKKTFEKLRKKYSIDENLSNKEARKIFIVRNEIASMGYTKYLPITIASNVSNKTIAYFEEMESAIPGVSIASKTERYYPNGTLAAHIIGYMGSISESESDYYVNQLGYSASDLIGKDGIEKSYESNLRGTDGVKKIEINSSGEYISTISDILPVKGEDVYLTIDLSLQKKAEEALKGVIKVVGNGGTYHGDYGTFSSSGQYSNCKSGAVVVEDVQTGEILAMASYPNYDPNIFSNGISTKDWESVQSTNIRDLLAPTPLYNIATKASVQPGSTFKPITAITALECGLDPNKTIYDKGFVKLGDRTYACSAWNMYRGSHGTLTLETGIGYSCNYYFYCVSTNKDYSTGKSLGYTKKISADKIMSVAKEFGLGEKTGIEIGEETTPLASASRKMENMRISLWNDLYNNATKYFPKSVYDNYDELKKNLDTITGWISKNPSRDEIIKLITENTEVKKSKIETVTDICKYSYFNMAQWTLGDVFNLAIGQGDNAYTPLQMANYIATLGNKGLKNQVSLVKGVENDGATIKTAATKINISDTGLLKYVIKGMKKVASGGTLGGVFNSLPVQVAAKTGTAEKAGKINPVDEVAYVKSHLSSFTSSVSWSEVEKMMTKLMKGNPDLYISKNYTVDEALKKASNGNVTQTTIDQFKGDYAPFAWVEALAPADNPKIAVSVLLIQGGISYNAGPIAREVIGKYFDTKNTTNTVISTNTIEK